MWMRLDIRRASVQDGMTLIELMVTLSIVGVLMAIAIPTVSNYVALQEIRGAAREVEDVLRDARDAAINEGRPHYVLFDPDPCCSYQVFEYTGSPATWQAKEGQVDFPDSVTFSDADVGFPGVAASPSVEEVPENAAYFDTRGRYPFGSASQTSYTVTLHGRLDKTETLTLYTSTRKVTGE
jgi:prepilin-type N-terminal cleavage/methylation domain-containing protein